jgi:type I restriction enzyme S subunit
MVKTDKIARKCRGEVSSPSEVSPVHGKSEINKNKGGETPPLRTDLPDGWRVLPLGRVLLNIVGGGTPSKANPKYWRGSIPWMTVKDMRTRRPADSIDHISEEAIKESATNLIPKDTVIIATRVGLGKVIRVPFDVTINQDLKALIPSTDVDKGFLEYWIVSIANYLEAIGSGTTVKGIRLETLRDIPIPLAPLNQQKRIVAEIEKQFSRLDEAVAALKRIQANLKRYKASVLKAAVEGKLTEQWRKEYPEFEPASQLLKRILAERKKKWEEDYVKKYREAHGHMPKDDSWKEKYKEPASPDKNNPPELPKGWVWATIEQLANKVQYGSSAKTNENSSGVPVLRMGNIFEGRLRLDDLKYLPQDHSEFPELLLKEGDFLFNRTNSPELVGKSAVYLGKPKPCSFASYLIRVQFNNRASSSHVSFYVNSSYGRSWIKAVVSQQVGQANVNGTKLQALSVPLPPHAEQHKIVEEVERRLSVTEDIDKEIETNLKRSERLRQSILQQAFSGKLV